MSVIVIKQNQLKDLLNPQFLLDLGCNPNKGILLMGKVGVGKTHTMREISKFNKTGFGSENQPTMYLEDLPVKKDDISGIGISTLASKKGDKVISFLREHDLYLDDMGSEKEYVNHFGNSFNPITEIIMMRYYLKDQVKTWATTNLNEDALTKRYGERVISRLREMMDFIVIVDGIDLRKENLTDFLTN